MSGRLRNKSQPSFCFVVSAKRKMNQLRNSSAIEMFQVSILLIIHQLTKVAILLGSLFSALLRISSQN